MTQLLAAMIAGLGVGGLYALFGQGLVVGFRGSGVINFAYGAIAAYAAFVFNEFRSTGDVVMPWIDPIPDWRVLKTLHISNLPLRLHLQDNPSPWVAAVAALSIAALIGLLMHVLIFRPLRNAAPLAKIIGSVGLLLYLQSLAALNFGTTNRSDTGWWLFSSDVSRAPPLRNFLGLGSNLPMSSLMLAATACVVGVAIWALSRWTLFGLATRAANENEKGAALLGFSTQRLAGLNWVLSAVLAGFAGIAFISQTQPSQMALLVVAGLSAALVGNLTSIPAATIGGLLIGMVASGGAHIAMQDWWPAWIPPEGLRQVVPLAVIIVVLYLTGDQLPTRGFLSVGRLPSAPAARHGVLGVAIAVCGVALLSNTFTGAWESTLTTTIVFTLFMLSLVVSVGHLGQVSLAQWSLAAVAAWTVSRVSADGSPFRNFDQITKQGLGLPTPVAMIAGVAAATLVGVVVGLPALRIRGVQLAVVTLAAVVAIEHLVLRNTWIMGEGAATQNPMPIPSLFGQQLGAVDPVSQRGDHFMFTVFLTIITVLVGVGVMNLRRGVLGRDFLAVRSNERAAAAAGIDVTRTKLIGFALSSVIAGLAGVMYAYKLPSLAPDNFNIFTGLVLLAFVYLGGITRIAGAIFGGCIVAGGLIAQFTELHFSTVDPAMIGLIGAVGLIVNAIVTHGEGVAAVATDHIKSMFGGKRQLSEGATVIEAPRDPSTPAPAMRRLSAERPSSAESATATVTTIGEGA